MRAVHDRVLPPRWSKMAGRGRIVRSTWWRRLVTRRAETPTKPHSLIRGNTFRQGKPSILRNSHRQRLSFFTRPLPEHTRHHVAPAHSISKKRLNMLPARHLTPQLRASVSTLADKALVSFIRVIVEINGIGRAEALQAQPAPSKPHSTTSKSSSASDCTSAGPSKAPSAAATRSTPATFRHTST